MASSTAHPQQKPAGVIRRAHREVRFGAYVLGSTLGEGEFGKVKLGWRKDGKMPSQVAIKLIKRDSIPKGSERECKVHREINALKKLSHPNIVRLEEVLQNDKYVGIVLDYASGGELFDYIYNHKHLKDSLALKLFAQLVSGVQYMHSKKIVHRDLKLENLLLDKHKNIIISDFGFVNSFSESELMKTSCGSPCYAAPELVLKHEPYEARKVDVWSCGVILYAMLAGYLPFDDDPENPEGSNISKLYNYISTTELTFPEYVQPLPRNLLRNILVPEPKYRYTLKQVCQHSWLAPHFNFLSISAAEWDRNAMLARYSNELAILDDEGNNRHRSKKILDSTTSHLVNASSDRKKVTSSSFSNNDISPHDVRIAPLRSLPSDQASVSTATVIDEQQFTSKRYSMVEPSTTSLGIMNSPPTTSSSGNPINLRAQKHPTSRPYSSYQVATAVNNSSLNISNSTSAYSNVVVDPSSSPSSKHKNVVPLSEDSKELEKHNQSTRIRVRQVSSNSSRTLPSNAHRPRPSSYHPGLLPDGPLAADFDFLKNSISVNKNDNENVGNGKPVLSNSNSRKMEAPAIQEEENLENLMQSVSMNPSKSEVSTNEPSITATNKANVVTTPQVLKLEPLQKITNSINLQKRSMVNGSNVNGYISNSNTNIPISASTNDMIKPNIISEFSTKRTSPVAGTRITSSSTMHNILNHGSVNSSFQTENDMTVIAKDDGCEINFNDNNENKDIDIITNGRPPLPQLGTKEVKYSKNNDSVGFLKPEKKRFSLFGSYFSGHNHNSGVDPNIMVSNVVPPTSGRRSGHVRSVSAYNIPSKGISGSHFDTMYDSNNGIVGKGRMPSANEANESVGKKMFDFFKRK